MRRLFEVDSFEKRDKESATTSRCIIWYAKMTITVERRSETQTYMSNDSHNHYHMTEIYLYETE